MFRLGVLKPLKSIKKSSTLSLRKPLTITPIRQFALLDSKHNYKDQKQQHYQTNYSSMKLLLGTFSSLCVGTVTLSINDEERRKKIVKELGIYCSEDQQKALLDKEKVTDLIATVEQLNAFLVALMSPFPHQRRSHRGDGDKSPQAYLLALFGTKNLLKLIHQEKKLSVFLAKLKDNLDVSAKIELLNLLDGEFHHLIIDSENELNAVINYFPTITVRNFTPHFFLILATKEQTLSKIFKAYPDVLFYLSVNDLKNFLFNSQEFFAVLDSLGSYKINLIEKVGVAFIEKLLDISLHGMNNSQRALLKLVAISAANKTPAFTKEILVNIHHLTNFLIEAQPISDLDALAIEKNPWKENFRAAVFLEFSDLLITNLINAGLLNSANISRILSNKANIQNISNLIVDLGDSLNQKYFDAIFSNIDKVPQLKLMKGHFLKAFNKELVRHFASPQSYSHINFPLIFDEDVADGQYPDKDMSLYRWHKQKNVILMLHYVDSLDVVLNKLDTMRDTSFLVNPIKCEEFLVSLQKGEFAASKVLKPF